MGLRFQGRVHVSDDKLVVRGLKKVFGGKTVLHDLDFEVRGGEFLSILGPSGLR